MNSLITCSLHQARTEWRHWRWAIVGWLVWLCLRSWVRVRGSEVYLGQMQEIGTYLLGIGWVFAVVWADGPLRLEAAIHTRPLGRAAVWLGKIFALLGMVFVPLLLTQSLTWKGFDLAWWSIVQLSFGVLCSACLMMGVGGALASLFANVNRAMIGGGFAVVGFFLWREMFSEKVERWLQLAADLKQQVGAPLYAETMWMLAVVLLMLVWWLIAVQRRKSHALGLMIAAVMGAPVINVMWQHYSAPVPLLRSYDKAALKLEITDPGPAYARDAQVLWPTIRLHGLGLGDVAHVDDFAPWKQGRSWPPTFPNSKEKVENFTESPSVAQCVNLEHGFPAGTLWFHHDCNANDSLTMDDHFDREPWRMKLSVNRTIKFAELPLRQLFGQSHQFVMLPGQRLSLQPLLVRSYGWMLRGLRSQVSSPLDRVASSAATSVNAIFIVLHDPVGGEGYSFVQNVFAGTDGKKLHLVMEQWQESGFEFVLRHPRARQWLMEENENEWMDRVQVSFWMSTYQGSAQMDLSADQMRAALEVEH
jgi:hypothetical protein